MEIIEIFSIKFTIVQFVVIIISIAGIIIGTVVAILLKVVPRIIDRKRRINSFYRVVWKKSPKLKPEDIFGNDIYRFKGNIPYHYRNIDNVIKEKISHEQNILIVGKPLAGKTRAIFQNLKELKRYVLVPGGGAKLDEIIIPKLSCSKRKKVIVLDNLQNFLERDRPEKRETALGEFMFKLKKRNIQIIASCRSGFELDLLDHKIDTNTIIKSEENIINIPELEKDKARNIIKKEWNQSSLTELFDGTIGSLILPLKEMQDRFNNAIEPEKNILVALKMLYITGIYDEKGLFLTNRVKLLCSTENLNVPEENFQTYLDNLERKEFIKVESYEKINAKDVYLEKIVITKYKSDLDIFHDIIKIFQKDPEVLFIGGQRTYQIGLVNKKSATYLEISVNAYKKALKITALENSPLGYADIQNNLGNAYGALAGVKGKEENFLNAIEAFKEAVKVNTLKDHPFDYAMIKNNLGTVYGALAGIKSDNEVKKKNCINAIKAFEEALKVRTLEDHPLAHATTQHNLGTVYRILAEVEDKKENCLNAIKAFEEAMKIKTLKDYPLDHAMIMNNLGNVYSTLAKVEDKDRNCLRAIEVFTEALKIRTLKDRPLEYASTQNNLGVIYIILAEAKDNNKDIKENCINAIKAFGEALKVRTLEDYPFDFAIIHNNLATVYGTLAVVEDKKENCLNAVKLFKEALKVFTQKDFPFHYTNTQNNLKIIYKVLAE